jgi:hypothetical protein
LIPLIVTARGTRDLQRQWYLAPAFDHIGGHGYLATLQKQAVELLLALESLFTGSVLSPAFVRRVTTSV